MQPTDDLRVRGYVPLMVPRELKAELPLSEQAMETVLRARQQIEQILAHQDRRLLVVVGPCSIHDETVALDYAQRLKEIAAEVADSLLLVMRVYFEKPRTAVGWKGLINDPCMDGSCNVSDGLRKARRLLRTLAEMGVPAATEMLDPIIPQYIADLVSWAAIGARTTESQTHREMASGLSMPVGFKNSTNGSLASAVNALVAARTPQSFVGIDQDGRTSVVATAGNPWVHLVLRGGRRPNYDPLSIEEARLSLIGANLSQTIMVDCSHANCMKKFQGQAIVWKSVIDQVMAGNEALVGLMLESNIHEGSQKYRGDPAALRYGVSITDECVSWETTATLLRWARARLRTLKAARPSLETELAAYAHF
jgi:3-deoxy-7-phosphoheptulonate synthase